MLDWLRGEGATRNEDRLIPADFRDLAERIAWLPHWVITLTLLAAGAALALAVHRIIYGVLYRLAQKRGLFTRALAQRTRRPSRLGLMIVGLGAAAAVAPMSVEGRSVLHHLLLMAFIGLVGWAAAGVLHISTVIYSRRFSIGVEDNLIARKHITQIKILERTATIFIGILTLAAALMTLEPVRQYGVTLLASAGAAGIIAGFALQPLLTNLIAGVQVAITQPIRIDDAVIVENEWGWIEEIRTTYVVVRLWDWRRMVLPLTYFIQNPFQNWTRDTSRLIGTTMIHVDYGAPVERMREKLTEIARASPLWDRDVVNLAVTDLTERTMEIRCLISARNAQDTFDLRCEVREKMIAFLKAEHPDALPRDRIDLEGRPGGRRGAQAHHEGERAWQAG